MGKKKNRDPYAGYDVSTEEGRQGYRNYYNARADFDAEMNRARWERAQEDPAYKAYAEREAAAAGFSLKELKQRWDINEANNKSSRNISNANNDTSLKIARMNAANQQQQTALSLAQTAAELSSRPADYFQASSFYDNANHMSQVPSWLSGMVNGSPGFAWVPPATGASGIVGQVPAMVADSATTPNADMNGAPVMAPAVSGDTSNGSTGTGTPSPVAGIANAQTVASTAPVNGTPVPTLDPQGSQAGSLAYTSALVNGQAVPQGMQSLGTIDQIARSPQKIAPGTLENLSTTQRDLLYSGLGRQGFDVPSFIKSYGAYKIGQGNDARAY